MARAALVMRVGSDNGSELGSANSNLEQHGRQDQTARVSRVTVAKVKARQQR